MNSEQMMNKCAKHDTGARLQGWELAPATLAPAGIRRRRMVKTERRMKMGKRNGLTAVAAAAAMLAIVALFAFAAPKDAMAGTLTVAAPKETASIHLGVNDPPASAKLDGWYCTDTDLRKTVSDILANVDAGRDIVASLERAKDWDSKLIKKGWPFKRAFMQKSLTVKGLDAPQGGTKTYKFKYCYTKAELQTAHDKLKQWLTPVIGD